MNSVNVHPGEALEEFLDDYGVSCSQLSRAIRVPLQRIHSIVRGKRRISADTAVRLSRFFGNRADFWLGLQYLYNIHEAEQKLLDELPQIHPIGLQNKGRASARALQPF